MYLHTRNIPRLPPLSGRHPTQKSCRAFILRGWNMGFCFGTAHKKIPLIPLRERAGQIAAQKCTGIAPVPLSFARERYGFRTGFLARFPARSLYLPGAPSGVFPSRAPLTAAGQHRRRTCFPAMKRFIIMVQKAGGLATYLMFMNFSYIISE